MNFYTYGDSRNNSVMLFNVKRLMVLLILNDLELQFLIFKKMKTKKKRKTLKCYKENILYG